MKTISDALRAHLAGECTTLATCWKIVRADGWVFGFCDHSEDILFDSLLYEAAAGITASNIKTSDKLDVDNLEVDSVLDSSSLNDRDLIAGLWDGASVEVFQVNWADLSMGMMHIRSGLIGEVKTGRTKFTAELRGLAQKLQQTIGRVYEIPCDADLGDVRCKLTITPVSGIVTTGIDQQTFLDSSLTQTTSPTQKAITAISQANPCVLECVAHGLADETDVTISGVVGMTQINGRHAPISYIDADHFSIAIDTSDTAQFSAYVSGGVATVTVESEFFQGGLLTWVTGPNFGLKMEVKHYAPGYIKLALPMLYAIAEGDNYSLTPGCDKRMETCRDRFSNVVNFRGFPHIPGSSRMISGT